MSLQDGWPDASAMTDPRVTVHLMSGGTLGLQDVSIMEVSKRLFHYGYVILGDGAGDYCVIFRHGVAAMTAEKADVAPQI